MDGGSMLDVRDYFEIDEGFATQWRKLSKTDKEDLKSGCTNGTFTY